jgi:hypothetical protein
MAKVHPNVAVLKSPAGGIAAVEEEPRSSSSPRC